MPLIRERYLLIDMIASNKNVLQIINFSLNFPASGNGVFGIQNLNISIPKGKTISIVGESGSGKTLTALSILKLNPNTSVISDESQIIFSGRDILKIDKRELNAIRGNEISMIFQEPLSSLNPLHTVEKQISEALILHKIKKSQDIRGTVIDLMHKVRINEPEKKLTRYPHQLSGGERQRVMIAMALANNPKLLIADEPTTALDVTVQYEILKLLKTLQSELDLTILFITHDLSIVKNFTDYVYVMQNGCLVEEGSTDSIFNEPRDAYTKRLVNARNLVGKREKRNKSLEILKLNSLSAQYEQKKLFRKKRVNKVVSNINLSINLGETIGLVGESGSGKTTIGLSILRLIKSDGSIIFMGDDLAKKSFKALKRIRKDLQIVFQDPFGSLSPRLTVEQIIEEGLIAQKIELDANSRKERVLEILKDVGLEPDQLNRYPHEFSGGQRQRIAIARAIILRPKLLVLDEPTSSLDATVQLQILNLLKKLQDKFNTSYIFISHDLRVIRYISDRVMVLNSGEIIEMDYTENIFNKPKNEYTKKLISSALLG